MPLPLTVAIVVVVAVALTLRIALRQLPLRSARPVGAGRGVTLALGVFGLVTHCAAMFFTQTARGLPGSAPYVDAVNGMSGASMVLYAVPATLAVAGLWRVPWWARAVVVTLLVLVGVTMYDGGPLTLHLTAILLVVVALSATVAALVGRRAGRVASPVA